MAISAIPHTKSENPCYKFRLLCTFSNIFYIISELAVKN